MNQPPIQRLGPYLIDGVVGKGAMGLVFAAKHDQTSDPAAIKVLAPSIASNEKFRERFAAEIESLKTLNHPNIVKLFGYGEHEGHLYYAMELVEGTNLEQELSGGRHFNWRDVTQIGIDVARALKHAHDHGVIHRDLKPANLLVDAKDQVKLTDFGIAKLFGSSDMTLSGNVLGTVDYMAPEQAAGEATSPRCDLYSLGCVMYALLVGKPPFQGKSIPEVLHKVRYEQHRPITQAATDVPEDLSQIIDELLEKDPESRIRTALSLTHRLRSIQQALSISTTDKADFSSDEDARAAVSSPTNLIVNPPPDIAERPTVFLTDTERQQSESRSAAQKKLRKKDASNQDHFTRIEREAKKSSESGRSSEFSSAIPLLLMLLTVLGGLMGGLWYSTQPVSSADDLYSKIISADATSQSKALARDIQRFLNRFPEDQRIAKVKDKKADLAIERLKKDFEIRARAIPETGSLSPIEMHCNEAFRSHRKANLEEAINTFKGIQQMYGTDNDRGDIRIQRTLELVERLLPQWEEQLDLKVTGLRAEAELYAKEASEIASTNPEGAKAIWEGIIKLHANRPWAAHIYQEAVEGLEWLRQNETADDDAIKPIDQKTDTTSTSTEETISSDTISDESTTNGTEDATNS